MSITLIFSQPKTILFRGGGLNEESELQERGRELGEIRYSLTIILESCTFQQNSYMCMCEMSKIRSNRARFLFKLCLSSTNCLRFHQIV